MTDRLGIRGEAEMRSQVASCLTRQELGVPVAPHDGSMPLDLGQGSRSHSAFSSSESRYRSAPPVSITTVKFLLLLP